MKKYLYMSLAAIVLSTLSAQMLRAQNKASLVKDSVAMGASYANEIYYSLANGEIASVPRNQWDIAFRTGKRSSSIMINEGSGVMLYTYSKADTSGWATFDTTGMKWTPMFNSYDDWENGAFSRNAPASGHPDYGWAIYNSVTHDLVGDSLFVIKLRDGSFRKLWIAHKYSSLDLYSFRFANLDGSADSKITIDCNPYASKNFVGYSILTSEIVDFEPAANSWDLLFAKYEALQPDGTLYSVTGVITNDGLKTFEFRHIDPNFLDWYQISANTSRSAIGFDWKTFNMNTFTYEVEDSLVYFVQDMAGNINKFMFTKFDGSSTGKIVFEKGITSAAGIIENKSGSEMTIYPNPVKDILNINLDNMTIFPVHITFSALTGQVIYALTITEKTGNAISIPFNEIKNGMYLLTAKSATGASSKKVVVNK
jgi:predicted lipoprotein with Yx(FWY)xxD motif